MRTKRVLLTLSLAMILAAGGLVVASNMGFKFVPSFPIAGSDYWVSLSYNNQYTNAQSLCTDIGASATLVSRFDTATNSRQDWTCPFGNNFPITPGEGYFIRVNAATTPVLVGSHDPTLDIPEPPQGSGFEFAGRDYILSIPYNTTATNAQDICDQVGASATLVSRFDTATNSRQDWTCPFGNNFSITIGEAYAVRVNAVTAAFVPAHY